MEIITATDLAKIVATRVKETSANEVAKDLEIAPVYLWQIANKHCAISKPVARRLGYDEVKQPPREKLFTPTRNK